MFEGYASAGIRGLRQSVSNAPVALSTDRTTYPDAVARAVSELRLAGVNGPYALLLGAEPYTAVAGGSTDGYPLQHHIRRLVDGGIIWAPAIAGGAVLSTRGGDFELHIGQDISIGYLDHTATVVHLYFQETFTFLMLTAEAAVLLSPPGA